MNNLRRLFETLTGTSSKESGQNSPLNSEDNSTDILGQSSFRLIYPINSEPGFHTEKYETALVIAEEFTKIFDQVDRQKYWDEHYTVFGLASCIVFDTHEKTYRPHHGLTQDTFLSVLADEKGRFMPFYIYPSDMRGIWPFIYWCISKYPFKDLFSFIKQDTYWNEINRHDSDYEYLEERLNEVERLHSRKDEVKANWDDVRLIDEAAKRFCFYFGVKDRKEGFSSGFNMLSIARNIITCPLSTYGEIFFQYVDGMNTREMLTFLRGEKKRFDNGENIRVPEPKTAHHREEKTEKNVDEVLLSSDTYPQLDQNIAASIINEEPIQIPEIKSGFDEYIVKEHRTKLTPFLVGIYRGLKPKQFGYMLYALDTLALLEKHCLTRHSEIHNALTLTFGYVGSRQRIQQLISELGSADSKEEHQIAIHKERIKSYLHPA